MYSTRTSCSIALFRPPDEKENYWKILVGKRRHTMNLSIFLYNVLPVINKIKLPELINIFDKLSVNEKNIILANNIETLWNFINYNSINNKIYGDVKDVKQDAKNDFIQGSKTNSQFNRIKKNFSKITSDDVNLRKVATAISSSRKFAEPEWVIPRGKRDNNEELLECAVRELKEETGIGLESYNIIQTDPTKFIYYDSYLKNKYEIIYFIAIEKQKTLPYIVCPREIVELQFIPINLIASFINDNKTIDIIKKMYKYVKKYKNAKKKINKEDSKLNTIIKEKEEKKCNYEAEFI